MVQKAIPYQLGIGRVKWVREKLTLPIFIKKRKRLMCNIIGISGFIGAGKTTSSNILVDKWRYISLSLGDLIGDILREEKIEVTRETQQWKGAQLIQCVGYNGIIDLLFQRHCLNSYNKYIIDGIRHIGVYLYLKEQNKDIFKLIFVEAPKRIRLERIKKRKNKDVSINTLDDLKILEAKEIEREVNDLKNYADFIIINDKDIANLRRELRKVFL